MGERPSPPRAVITRRDRLLLAMAAEHRLILPAHVGALLGISRSAAGRRLRTLDKAGYLSSRRLLAGQPMAYQISRRGLELIGSTLPAPRIDLNSYAHDVGVAWLWLAAHAGTFGAVREVVGERTMRSADGRLRAGGGAGGPQPPWGVRLGGTGPGGRPRLHYPDLVLITPEGRRLAIELELTAKGRARREQILAGYGADVRIDAVLYLVERPALARAVRESARRLGVSPHVHVQWVRGPSGPDYRSGLAAARAPVARGDRSKGSAER
jgi:hypothetical protein